MNFAKAFLPLAFSSLMLTGCGGSSGSGGGDTAERIDYSGTTSAAVLTSGNAETFADSSSEVLASRLKYNSADDLNIPYAVDVSGSANTTAVEPAVEALTSTVQRIGLMDTNLPVAASVSETINGSCGGSMNVSGSGDENNASGTITFNNYCEDGATINGKISVDARTTATQEIENLKFSSLTVRRGDETIQMSGYIETKEALDSSGASDFYISVEASIGGRTMMIAGREVCTSYGNCVGSDYIKSAAGYVYRLDDFSVQQNGNLLDLNGEFYHPALGYVGISGNDLAVCDGSFSSGTIALRDATQVLTIEFSSCGQYTTTLSPSLQER